MFCSRTGLFFVTALFASLAACARNPNPPVQRIAVLRFENLTSDPSLDWMGRAFSDILSTGLSASPDLYDIPSTALHKLEGALGARPVSAPGISEERDEALISGASRLVYGRFSSVNGSLRVDVSEEDPAAQKIVRTISVAGPLSHGIFPLATSIAQQLTRKVRPFGTQSQEALRHYVSALETSDLARMAQALSQSVAADPNFGSPYLMLWQLAMSGQDRAAAERILEQARARGNAISEPDRTRLDLDAAILHGDTAGRERALIVLTRLDPNDPNSYRDLAQISMQKRQYRQSAGYYQRALRLEPNEAAWWNSLGYVEAYGGDLKAATEALRRYERLRPQEANPLDSLGDVHFYAGRFPEAEKFYLEAQQKDPNFLNGAEVLKAAQARLMTGDIQGADGVFQRYLEARRSLKDPSAEYQRAEWSWLTGRRRAALEQMESIARTAESGPLRRLASPANTQLAIWRLALGDRIRARGHAERAVALATQQSAVSALVIRFLTEPETSSSDWAVRAERVFPQPIESSVKELAVAYALLFHKQFDAAIPLLQQRYARPTPDADEGLSALLAWAYVETGRYQQASPLLRTNPIPPPAGVRAFETVYFPRLFFLRGVLLEKQRRREEARQSYRLFLAFSGPEPLAFGEEARAKAALSR